MSATPIDGDVAARARDWHHGLQAVVCDVVEPWAHGTVLRATGYPSYYDFNLVRVEDDPGMSVAALMRFADEALAGLVHRRVDFDLAAAAEPLRPGFEAEGWRAERLLWMRHETAPPPAGPDLAVEEVHYDAVHELRAIWDREDFPDVDPGDYPAHAREVAMRRHAQVLAVRERGEAVAFAQLERDGAAAEITQVYVHPEHRGGGRGTAMTRAAIEAAGDLDDLWIVADDEDRPKQLYARLGFRPAWTTMEFQRLPASASW
ncbi:MAG: GNAT family N-acetyltransferase [Solirubrobacterales bacterium]|nr:GNAT family N-acetyltransferase [Solirubrobacterales bacterium]